MPKVLLGSKKEKAPVPQAAVANTNSKENGTKQTISKKVCYFCESGREPSYTDSVTLRKFMNDRIRIVSHLRSGVCSKHQRRLTKEIKHARHLALLPFIPTL